MAEKLKVGIIGVGNMGERHLKKYVAMPHIEVAGIFDTQEERAEAVAATYVVKAFRELDELLFECDAVVVASSTPSHYQVARAALEAGAHVLIEKPIAQTVAEAEALVELAHSKNLVLQVGFLERFRYVGLSRSLGLGRPRFIECDRLALTPGRELGLDVVSDLMIHDLDLVLSIVEEFPAQISAVGVPVLTSTYDIANVRLEFPAGAVANVTASRVSSKPKRKFRVFWDQGYASFDLAGNHVELFYKRGSGQLEHVTHSDTLLDPLKAQCESFIDCILHGKRPVVSGGDAVQSLQLVSLILARIAERYSKGLSHESAKPVPPLRES